MSSVAGFKQQCPSCGGQITIKNPGLVGKKVDCPKCKYRFIVLDPDAEADEHKKEPSGERPAKKKAEKSERAAKKAISKAAKETNGESGEDTPHKKKKKEAAPGNKKRLYILAGSGVALVLIVAVVMFFTLFKSDSPSSVSGTTGGGNRGPGSPAPAPGTEPGRQPDGSTGTGQDSKPEPLSAEALNDPTNLLPNDTQVVFNMPIARLVDSRVGNAIFHTAGAFRVEDFESRLGIPLDNIERMVIAGNRDRHESFVVIRTRDAYDWNTVKTRLQVNEETKTPVVAAQASPADTQPVTEPKEYYLGKVDFLAEFLSGYVPIAELRGRAAVYRRDRSTLIYGSEKAVERFLREPPKIQTEQAPPLIDTNAPGVFPGAPVAPPEGAPGAPNTPSPSAAPVPGGPAAPAAQPTPAMDQPRTYITLTPVFRKIIALSENKKRPLLLYAIQSSRESALTVLPFLSELEASQRNQIKMAAVALDDEEQLTMTVAMLCSSSATAKRLQPKVEELLTNAAKGPLKDALGFEIKVRGPQTAAAETPGAEMPEYPGATPGVPPGYPAPGGTGATPPGYPAPGGRGGVPPGYPAPGGRGGAPPGYPAPGGTGAMPPGYPSPGGRGGVPPGYPAPGGRGGVPPGYPAPGGRGGVVPPTPPDTPMPDDPGVMPGEPLDEEDPHASTIWVTRQDEFILVYVTVLGNTDVFVSTRIAPQVIKLRGQMAMSEANVGLSRLAILAEKAASLPVYRGTLPRTPDASRGRRPWPPHERVSWMRELLPLLGDRYAELYNKIDPEKGWRDADNIKAARILVPHFAHPGVPLDKLYARIWSVDQPMALTHFVGMGGVGPDAPYYPKDHPDAGIFGYDRETKKEDIKDGLANTILLIQVDPALAGPWLAGGGSTVRGTRPRGQKDIGVSGGFMSPPRDGKPGVLIVMADGAIRWLSADTPPDVFHALCTMAGNDNDKIGDLDKAAPRVHVGGAPVASAPAAAKPAPPKVEPKEGPEVLAAPPKEIKD